MDAIAAIAPIAPTTLWNPCAKATGWLGCSSGWKRMLSFMVFEDVIWDLGFRARLAFQYVRSLFAFVN